MTAKHTPGPWTIGVPSPSTAPGWTPIIGGENRIKIAWVLGSGAVARANAHVLVAAPDLRRELGASLCPGRSCREAGPVRTVDECLAGGHCGCSAGAAIGKADGP